MSTHSPLFRLINWAEGILSSPAFNSSRHAVSWSVVDSRANADACIVPKGQGAFVIGLSDGTVAGGNKRGVAAVDLQGPAARSTATQVSTPDYSAILGGFRNSNTSTTATASVIAGGSLNAISSPGGVGDSAAGGANQECFRAQAITNFMSGSDSTLSGGNYCSTFGFLHTITGVGDYRMASGSEALAPCMSWSESPCFGVYCYGGRCSIWPLCSAGSYDHRSFIERDCNRLYHSLGQ